MAPNPERTKVQMGDAVDAETVGPGAPPRPAARPADRRGWAQKVSNDWVWLELDRLLDDALSVTGDASAGGRGARAAARHIEMIQHARTALERPGRHLFPFVARRRALVYARDVARRCREELYLYLDEQRVQGTLPRLRHRVETTLGDDVRGRAYVAAIDQLIGAPSQAAAARRPAASVVDVRTTPGGSG